MSRVLLPSYLFDEDAIHNKLMTSPFMEIKRKKRERERERGKYRKREDLWIRFKKITPMHFCKTRDTKSIISTISELS